MEIPLASAQLKLLRIWLVAAIPLLVITLTRIFGHSGKDMADVWATISPAILPGLTTVAGAFALSQLATNSGKVVNEGFFKTAVWVSYVYLGAFLAMFLFYPSFGDSSSSALDRLKTFVVVLHALDVSVVAACLAAFFTAKRPT
jgi:hypothetical protein